MLILVPILAWVICGSLKFAINFLKHGKEAFKKIGNGGFPSTHTTIVTTTAVFIAYVDGINSTTFLVAATITVIVIIDALGIRRTLGVHASILNTLIQQSGKLRESQGHNKVEVLGGIVVGFVVANICYYFYQLILH